MADGLKKRFKYPLIFTGVVALFVAGHFYDPPLDPGYEAFMAETLPPPEADNGFFDYIAMSAPSGVDIHAAGVALVARNAEERAKNSSRLRENMWSALYLAAKKLISENFDDFYWHFNAFRLLAVKNEQEKDLLFLKQGRNAINNNLLYSYDPWQHARQDKGKFQENLPGYTPEQLTKLVNDNAEGIARFKKILSYPFFYRISDEGYQGCGQTVLEFRRLYEASLVLRARGGDAEGALLDAFALIEKSKKMFYSDAGVSIQAILFSSNIAATVILRENPELAQKYLGKIDTLNIASPSPDDVKKYQRTEARAEFRSLQKFDDAQGVLSFLYRPNATKNRVYACERAMQEAPDVNAPRGTGKIPSACVQSLVWPVPTYNLAGHNFENNIFMNSTPSNIPGFMRGYIAGTRMFIVLAHALADKVPAARMGDYMSQFPKELWNPVDGKAFVWDAENGSITMETYPKEFKRVYYP